jgi:hypothetical protein
MGVEAPGRQELPKMRRRPFRINAAFFCFSILAMQLVLETSLRAEGAIFAIPA